MVLYAKNIDTEAQDIDLSFSSSERKVDMTIFWAAAIVVFIVVEAATVGLVSVWFAIGAFGALICAQLGAEFWAQALIFLVLSAVALAFTRPLAKKHMANNINRTNADRVFDMIGVVTERIDNLNQTGAVQVGGKLWSARSDSGSIIESGEKVRAVRIEGVKLIVVPQEAAEPVKTGANLKEEK